MDIKKILLIIAVLFVLVGVVQAQIDWVPERDPYPVGEDQQELPLYYLYRGVHYDFKYDDQGAYICDITYHQIVKTTNDQALSSENKIYISMVNVIDVLDIKARTISKDGVTVTLDQEDVKEVQDEENKGGYRIFAVEGAEVGGEIEYRYVKRVNGSYFLTDAFQMKAPIKQYDFVLTSPENLEFDFFVANDTASVQKIEAPEGSNRYVLTINDVPEYVSEGFSGFDADKKRVDFKLAYNTINGSKRRLNTFSDAGKTVYTGATNLSKSEEKSLSSIIKELDKGKGSKLDRFRQFEHEVKQQYFYDESGTNSLVDLEKNKVGDKRAFLNLFVGYLRYLELEYEIIVTSERNEKKFEKKFDSWNYLTDYLIYLPSADLYMSPYTVFYRLGTIPASLTATYGIFIKPTMVQDFVYPVTRVAYIPEVSYQQNMNNIYMSVAFSDDFTANDVEVDLEYIGEESEIYKAAFLRMNDEQKSDMQDRLVSFLSQDSENKETRVKTMDINLKTWKEPFVLSASFSTAEYLETAGNNLLFQVGKLIGPQSEMYQDEVRRGQVENSNNRGYRREISLKIPDGYAIQNLDDLIIEENVHDHEELIFTFNSSYKVEGDELKIFIDEYYNRIFYPKEGFEAFRKVINAAADWNKVVLVMKRI